MAKVYKNDKGFKVIAATGVEMSNIGGLGICDSCGEVNLGLGYYVAVLNRWFCPRCFNDWYEVAENFAIEGGSDKRVEDKNFAIYKEFLKAED